MKWLLFVFCALFALSNAKTGFGPGEQDWGYVTVRDDAYMFWWLYYTTADVQNYTERPLVIWLQGGPGASSTGYGNFAELGPLDLDLQPRNFTWVNDCNVLFLDSPVGTGYSYVNNPSAYTKTNRQIADDLVSFMKKFYQQLPEFKRAPLYITAESYGGKMAAEFALVLDEEIKAGNIECDLRGVGLGDSWISPIDSVLTWAPFLLHLGFVDDDGFKQIDAEAQETRELVEAGQWEEATSQWGYTEFVILQMAHNIDFYNVLKKIKTSQLKGGFIGKDFIKPSARNNDDDDVKLEEIMNNMVREELNITHKWGAQKNQVFTQLYGDFMKPNTDVVEQLLNSTDLKVFIFTGQLDLIVDTPGTVLWVDKLNWVRKSEWDVAHRYPIKVGGYIEGFEKEVGNLGLYWVNRAGHMVPADNPPAMDYILRKLTDDYQGA